MASRKKHHQALLKWLNTASDREVGHVFKTCIHANEDINWEGFTFRDRLCVLRFYREIDISREFLQPPPVDCNVDAALDCLVQSYDINADRIAMVVSAIRCILESNC